MDRGLALMSDWLEAQEHSWAQDSRLVREAWWWGQGATQLQWQERVFAPRPAPGAGAIQKLLATPGAGAADLEAAWQAATAQWQAHPKQATADRRVWRQFWKDNHARFERGQAVEARDPSTGERTRGVVVGFDLPSQHWDASQVGMVVWLVTQPRPLVLPLPVWFESAWGGLRPLDRPASPQWFNQSQWPVAARLLVGPPGLVAAWGVRQKVRGELVRLVDGGQTLWGWRMPATWSWEHALAADRELANTIHAQAYLRQRPNRPLSWRWSPTESIDMQPQAGGIVITGSELAWNRMTFPLRRQCTRPDWTSSGFQCTLTWKRVRPVFESLMASGAIPTVPADQADWVRMTWPKKR
jgi:hypothetical protein